MKKRARGKRRGRGQGAQDTTTRDSATPPVLLSISPQGVTLPEGVGASSEAAARLRRELEAHARDVDDFVRAKRFEAIVTRVLADIEPRRDAPRLRLRSSE